MYKTILQLTLFYIVTVAAIMIILETGWLTLPLTGIALISIITIEEIYKKALGKTWRW